MNYSMSEFRPMRRKRQELAQEESITILQKATSGTLALLGDNGYPYGIPINFTYEDNRFYFHGAREGHKIDAITRNPKASLCVLDEGVKNEGEWWWCFNSVIAFGHIRIVEDEAEIEKALRAIGEKYFPTDYDLEADVAKNLSRVCILALEVDHMTGKAVREK
jgi:nitroimidazol reductase NimA-like FMN-containing flavoprotein (pyridoxamine 5'-phosphate oxidase superfamily)